MALEFPSSPAQTLLWAQSLLLWAVASYALIDGTSELKQIVDGAVRSAPKFLSSREYAAVFAAGIVGYFLPGLPLDGSAGRLGLASITTVAVGLAPLLRRRFARHALLRDYLAELETAYVVATGITLASWIAACNLVVARPLLSIKSAESIVLPLTLAAATTVVACRGGTHFVRGLLLKSSDAKPRREAPYLIEDRDELKRGQLIGNLERILLLVACFTLNYEVVGFLVAAKGLIRTRRIAHDDDFVEYFIIGNLASVLVALALAMFLQWTIPSAAS